VLQVQAVAALLIFAVNVIAVMLRTAGRSLTAAIGVRRAGARRTEISKPGSFAALARRDDVLIVLGSPWFNAGYARLIERLRREFGMRFAVLVHDIVPLRRPEWCNRELVRSFRAWYGSVLPASDAVFSVSRATAEDLKRYAASAGILLKGPVQPVPVGTCFGGALPPTTPDSDSLALPEPGSYVLFVSTIEARKNHGLLFRVWRKMVDELPADEIPILVFAGRIGWLVADLMQQLENARFLDGKIRLVLDPSDTTLNRLYSGCLFTLFPSLFEGWGLPVTESLAFGKPCVASNRTSIPEAGRTLARYFDPESLPDAYRVIRGAIDDRAELAAWENRVVHEFRPVSWDETAAAIVRQLDDTVLSGTDG
jgi:glycosyltransferase involved in cell wall biosynthesis